MNKVVIIDGLRTPFIKSYKSIKDISPLELSIILAKEFIYRNNLNKDLIDEIIWGNVFFNNSYSNIAREIALSLDLHNVPAFTVTKACATGLQVLTSGIESILSNRNKIVLCGGVESISQMSITLNIDLVEKLKNFKDKITFLYNFENIIKDSLKLKEYSTNLQMGDYAEITAKKYNISREEQDIYSLNSHIKAKKAIEENILKNEIMTLINPYSFEVIKIDNNVRFDTNLDKLSSLEPVFDKKFGSVTAGNSSPLTDGASTTLIMSENKAKELGFIPKVYIKDFIYVAIDNKEDLLIGNAYSIPKILKRNNLKISDIDIFEMHEAFASQVLATQKLLDSEKFCNEELNQSKVCSIPEEKLNIYGGSIAIGHPFSATGLRMINTISNEMERKNYKYGLVSVCAAGAMSGSILLERV